MFRVLRAACPPSMQSPRESLVLLRSPVGARPCGGGVPRGYPSLSLTAQVRFTPLYFVSFELGCPIL
jgi:hypothetical protein